MKFMKTVCVFLGTTSLATASLGGFYFGPSIGNSNIHINNNVVFNTSGVEKSYRKRHTNSFIAGLMGGWGIQSHCLYGAIEADWFNNKTHKTLISEKPAPDQVERFRLKHHNQYGGGFRFGYTPSLTPGLQLLFFVRMGIQVSNWKWNYRIKDPALPKGHFSRSTHVNKLSYIPGIGAEVLIGNHVAIRAEIRYMPTFSKRLKIGSIPPGSIPIFENSTLSSRISQTSTLVTLVYHI